MTEAARVMRFLTPRQLVQRYNKLKLVGQGTFGKVFRAHDQKTNKLVALKFVRLKNLRNMDTFIVRELVTLRTLAPLCKKCHLLCYHTHFLTMLKTKPHLVIVMQFVSGGDLNDQADHKGPDALTAKDAHKIATQLFEALKCLHALGFAHRDIKPANVLFHKGQVTVADFGLSCLKQLCTGASGTPAYMWSVVRKSGQRKHLSLDMYKANDVYGAAKTILRLLQGPSVDETMRGKLDGPSKSPELSELMKQIMKHPDKYSAAQVLQKLKKLKTLKK